jgi:hypothetical protein
MSNRHREELIMVARRAAQEAQQRERVRCMWIVNRILTQAGKDIDGKVLTAQQAQLVKVRFEITKSICKAIMVLIQSNVQPPKQVATATKVDPRVPPEALRGIIDEPQPPTEQTS